ncbi:MAG: NAD(P)/FAD-dependent oxidoreductase [Aeoliella sp.]
MNPTEQTENDSQHWAIVGGGMLGMTLAHRLAERGQRVTLLESAPTLGGLTSAWSLGDVVWDRYYHVTLLSDNNLRRLLGEIGLEEEMKWIETKTGFYSDGKLHSMSNAMAFLNFPPLTFIEKLRLGGTIFYASKIRNWKRLEKISVVDWLRRWSGPGTFAKIWQPLLRAKLGEAYKTTSAAFIWAHINRMYKARRSGLKKEMFGYVPGGYARVLDRFTSVLETEGVEVVCDAAVRQAVATDGGQVEVTLAAGDVQTFDQVIFTIPSPYIGRACPQLTADEQTRFANINYLGIVCASLVLKKPISKYYVTNITDTWVPLTAIIEMTTIVDRAEMGGHSLVYLPKYIAPGDDTYHLPDEQIEERFLSTLEKMYDDFNRDDVLAFRVSRTRTVMALPTLGYSEHLPPMKTSVPGVFAVNSAHILKGNLNVNETIEIAEDAVRDLFAPMITQGNECPPSLPTSTPTDHVEADSAKTDRELVARS